MFDGCRGQFVLVVQKIEIKDGNGLEFFVARLRVAKPRYGAQHC